MGCSEGSACGRQTDKRKSVAHDARKWRLRGTPAAPVESLRREDFFESNGFGPLSRPGSNCAWTGSADGFRHKAVCAGVSERGCRQGRPDPRKTWNQNQRPSFPAVNPRDSSLRMQFENQLALIQIFEKSTPTANLRRLTTHPAMVSTSFRALCACHKIHRIQAGRTLPPLAFRAIKQPLAVVTRTRPGSSGELREVPEPCRASRGEAISPSIRSADPWRSPALPMCSLGDDERRHCAVT
jgi:hypothetical protein